MSRSRVLLVALACLVSAGGCGLLPGQAGPAPAELRLREGLLALERGRFDGAEAALGELASRCESGARGRTAVLLLAASALDPRNPSADPGRAAALTAFYLGLPGSPDEDVAVARSLYLAALERGAEPLDEAVSRAVPGVASRFERCDGGGVVEYRRLLPAPPGATLSDRLRAAEARGDSLASRLRGVAGERDSLRGRVGELEAELDRIRKLLQGGGGRPPGPAGSP